MAEKYLIGDTIRFTASMVKLDGEEYDPDEVKIAVFLKDGTELLKETDAEKIIGKEGEYKYDWLIDSVLKKDSRLVVVWSWNPPKHLKKMDFIVESAV